MKTFIAELHVHTVLSPCAEIEMIPPFIVQEALDRGINLIAITDHNASANVRAVQQAAANTDLVVLAGMEIQTREEVHMLCLFDTAEQVEAWQSAVDLYLPDLPNRPDYFGDQYVVDASGDFVRHEPRLSAHLGRPLVARGGGGCAGAGRVGHSGACEPQGLWAPGKPGAGAHRCDL